MCKIHIDPLTVVNLVFRICIGHNKQKVAGMLKIFFREILIKQ